MSVRKLQRLQVCEPLQGLQILVKLSTTPVLRTLLAIFIRHQLALVGIIFVVTLMFAQRENAPWVTVRQEVAIEFFSTVSQSLAALLGVLIVLLTFYSQLIGQRRMDYYRELQAQIHQLIRFTQELTPELSDFNPLLVKTIDYLVPLHLKDLPIRASTSQVLPLDKLIANLKNEWVDKKQKFSLAAHLNLQQILLTLSNIEEILEGFSMLYNRILEIGRFILAIAKLSLLLGISLLFLLLFGIVDLQSKFPDLSLPVIVALAMCVFIVLVELVLDTWLLYKNLHGPWSHLVSHWYCK
ncbi:MAG: hypothetical protein PUP91_12995 [Rhizonema sp. PD37]|nr:hypothetical protein [Rhizonema sp. PD37]